MAAWVALKGSPLPGGGSSGARGGFLIQSALNQQEGQGRDRPALSVGPLLKSGKNCRAHPDPNDHRLDPLGHAILAYCVTTVNSNRLLPRYFGGLLPRFL